MSVLYFKHHIIHRINNDCLNLENGLQRKPKNQGGSQSSKTNEAEEEEDPLSLQLINVKVPSIQQPAARSETGNQTTKLKSLFFYSSIILVDVFALVSFLELN